MTANNSKHRDQANNVQPYDMSFHGRDLLLFHINNCFIRNSWRIYKKNTEHTGYTASHRSILHIAKQIRVFRVLRVLRVPKINIQSLSYE